MQRNFSAWKQTKSRKGAKGKQQQSVKGKLKQQQKQRQSVKGKLKHQQMQHAPRHRHHPPLQRALG
jgi:hypothetical protein